MLIITMEGGLVSSITSDDAALIATLNQVGLAVIDYDVEGAYANELVSVKLVTEPGRPRVEYEAVGHIEKVGRTDIDTAWLANALGLDVLFCRICGDAVKPADIREHLCWHNPNAQGMAFEDVTAQFQTGETT